jgi:hypothetical protein
MPVGIVGLKLHRRCRREERFFVALQPQQRGCQVGVGPRVVRLQCNRAPKSGNGCLQLVTICEQNAVVVDALRKARIDRFGLRRIAKCLLGVTGILTNVGRHQQ